MTDWLPGSQPTWSGRPAPFGKVSSRSDPLSRFITHTLAGVESAGEDPRRKPMAPPSGESTGYRSAIFVKVIGVGCPPSGRPAYRSLLDPGPPTNTTYASR